MDSEARIILRPELIILPAQRAMDSKGLEEEIRKLQRQWRTLKMQGSRQMVIASISSTPEKNDH